MSIPYLIFVILLMFVMNGLPITSGRLRSLPPKIKKLFGLSNKFYKFLDFRAAAPIMRDGGVFWLTFSWIIYGLFFLVVPFILLKIFPNPKTPSDYISQLTDWILTLFNTQNVTARVWILVLLSLAFVGILGYFWSRVWFSWYLAVSLAFNGHNNEAGGAARIEGFKHILRIKVEKEQLTVYVIGFDDAEHELEKLKLKLVDKFTLKCKPII